MGDNHITCGQAELQVPHAHESTSFSPRRQVYSTRMESTFTPIIMRIVMPNLDSHGIVARIPLQHRYHFPLCTDMATAEIVLIGYLHASNQMTNRFHPLHSHSSKYFQGLPGLLLATMHICFGISIVVSLLASTASSAPLQPRDTPTPRFHYFKLRNSSGYVFHGAKWKFGDASNKYVWKGGNGIPASMSSRIKNVLRITIAFFFSLQIKSGREEILTYSSCHG